MLIMLTDYLVEEAARVPRYVVRDRNDPLTEFHDFDFREEFRRSKHSFAGLMAVLNLPENPDRRGGPISPALSVMFDLRFLAGGTFHRETGVYESQSMITDTLNVY